MKETGLTSSVRKFMFVCSSINGNIIFFWTLNSYMGPFLLYGPKWSPPPPQHTTHSQRKRKQKERKGVDGGLNMLFLLERHNFVYFNNVTINHSSPYHSLSEKWLITIGVCTQRLAVRQSGSQAVRQSGSQAVTQSRSQKVRESDCQAVRRSESQPVS